MADIKSDSTPVADEYGNQATSSLWIKYVPLNTNGFTIQEYFMRWGQVESVAPVGNAKARSGWAIVNYYTVEDATRAYQSQNNRVLFDGDHPCFIKFTPAKDVARPRARPKLDAAAQAARDEWFGSSSQSTGTTTEDRIVAPHEFVRPPPVAPKSMRTQVSPPPIRRSAEFGASRISESDTWRPGDEDRTRVDGISDSWRPHDRYNSRTEQDIDAGPRRHTADTYRPVDKVSDKAQDLSPGWKKGFRNNTWVKPAEEPATEDGTVPKSTSSVEPPTIKSPFDAAKARAAEVAKRLALGSPAHTPASLMRPQLPSLSNDDTVHQPIIPQSPEPSPPLDPSVDHQAGEVRLTRHTLSSPFLVPRFKNINDETTSVNSSSTHTSVRKRACADCKGIETSISPFIKCAGCTRRFHQTCGNPPPSATRAGNFRCGKCLREEAPTVPLPTSKFLPVEAEGTTVTPAQRQVNADTEIQDHHAVAIDGTSMVDDPLPKPISTPTMVAVPGKWPTSGPTNTFSVKGPSQPTCAMVDGVANASQPLVERNHDPDRHFSPKEIAQRYKCLTCPHWRSGRCKFAANDCHYAHQPTGVDVPWRRNTAKHFTCFFWKNDEDCSDGPYCRFAHEDTGIYVTEYGDPSLKHVTCSFWRISGCRNVAADCGFAHEDTGIYGNQSKESHLIKPRSSRNAAALERWPSRAMQAPEVDQDSRDSTSRATEGLPRSTAVASSTRDADDTPNGFDQGQGRATIEHRESPHDAALASHAESCSAPEAPIARAARGDQSLFEETRPDHAPANSQQTSSVADIPSQSGTLGSLEPASSNVDGTAAAKALYASFGISLESPPDNVPRARFPAPGVDTAASPVQQGLRGKLIHGIDTPYSPGADSSVSNATAPYSSPRAVTHPSTNKQRVDTATSTATSRVLSDPKPTGLDDRMLGLAQLQTPPTQTAHDHSSNPSERRTAADTSPASAEPRRHMAKRSGLLSGRDPRKERMEILRRQQLAKETPSESVADSKILASTTSTVKTCETCSKKIFSGLLCKACQKTDIIATPASKQPSPMDEEADTDALSIITELVTSVKPNLDFHSPKPAYTERSLGDAEQSVKAVSEKPNGVMSSLKRPAESSPFIKQKRPKIGLWPPRPVVRQNVDESPEATAARRALEDFKEQEVLRKASQRAAARQIPRLGATTPDGTDSNKENRQPSTVPSEDTSSGAYSVSLAADHVSQAPREGYGADTTSNATPDQRRLAAQASAPAEKTSTVAMARPQPPVVTPSVSVAPTCQNCRESHRKCLHTHNGVAYDATKCKTYLESHPNATCMSLAISGRAFQEVVRSAETAGFSFSPLETDYEVEDESEAEEEYSPPPVTSNSAIKPSTRCCNCRASHKRCFHTHDGTAYDPSKCKEYLQEHPNASCLTLAISGHTFRKIVKNAKMAGFTYSSVESDQDVDDSSEEEGHSVASPILGASMHSDIDDSSDDDRPIYQSKKRKSQAETETLMKVASFRDDTVKSMESSFQKSSVDPRRRDIHEAAKHLRNQGYAVPFSVPKPPQPAQRTSTDLQEAIAKLKARGVEFESDSDEEVTEACSVSTRKKLNRGPPGSSLDLFDIAPSLRPQKDDNEGKRPGLLSAKEVGHVSKKQIWKTLLARQCRERKLKFGDPHQEVEREVGSRNVATLIKRDAPEDQARAKVDRFHVPAKEEKVIKTTFENFLGVPKEPVVCREWSGEGHKTWFELAYRDGRKGATDAPFSRRNAADEKYVFTKS